MASEVKTNKISPATSTTINVGDSGDTLALATDAVTGFNVGSDAQGDILYYSGTDYVRLGAGTNGQALKTAGTGANPAWGDVTSTGDFANGGDTATANRVLGNNDSYSLGFETNGSTRLSIAANGFMTAHEGFGVGNTQTVDTTVSTPASENTMSVGPVTIDAGVTVTIGASSYWTIV